MLNISGISEGFVLDHIQAGMSLQIYHDLNLDKLDCTVAIIKNAKSNKMGKKDIIKVECPIEALDLDILESEPDTKITFFDIFLDNLFFRTYRHNQYKNSADASLRSHPLLRSCLHFSSRARSR